MSYRNKNRFRKVYPFIRRKPFNVPEGDVIYDVKNVSVGTPSEGSDEITVTFTTTFTSAPIVTATAYDGESSNEANVNVYIKSVSTSQVVLGFSAAFFGNVHVQAIQSV